MNVAKCGQCGKQAIYSLDGALLCIDCFLKYQQAMALEEDRLVRQMNYLTASMEQAAGLPGALPRYEVRKPVVQQGPVTLNNINVDNSVVGAINTGQVQQIDVAMSHLRSEGDAELATAIKDFTEATMRQADLDIATKNAVVEQVSFLAAQSTLPEERRSASVAKAVLACVRESVALASGLVALWDKLAPLFHRFFV